MRGRLHKTRVTIWLLLASTLVASSVTYAATVKVRTYEGVLDDYFGRQGIYLLSRSRYYDVVRMEQALYEDLRGEYLMTVLSDDLALPGLTFDTYHDMPEIPATLADFQPEGQALYLIQFLDSSATFGTGLAAATSFYASGVLVWTDEGDREFLDGLVRSESLFGSNNASSPPPLLQYAGPYHPYFKISEAIDLAEAENTRRVVVQLLRHDDLGQTEQRLEQSSLSALEVHANLQSKWVVADLAADDLIAIAQQRDVISIFPAPSEPDFGYSVRPLKSSYLVGDNDRILDATQPDIGLQFREARSSGQRLLRLTDEALNTIDPINRQRLSWVSDDILLPEGDSYRSSSRFDSQDDIVPPTLRIHEPLHGRRLHLVQLLAHNTSLHGTWLRRIRNTGAEIARNTGTHILLWADDHAVAELDQLVLPSFGPDGTSLYDSEHPANPLLFLRYSSPFHPYFKIEPGLAGRRVTQVTVRLFRNPDVSSSLAVLAELSPEEFSTYSEIDVIGVQAVLSGDEILEAAHFPDVLSVGSRHSHIDENKTLFTVRTRLVPVGTAGVSHLFSGSPYDYLRITDTALNVMPLSVRHQLFVLSDRLTVNGFSLDAFEDEAPVPTPPNDLEGDAKPYLVQYHGWPLERFRERVRNTGALQIHGLADYGELLWTQGPQRDRLAELLAPPGLFASPNASDPPHVLKRAHELVPALKVRPGTLENWEREFELLSIEIYRSQYIAGTLSLLESKSPGPLLDNSHVLHSKRVVAWLRARDIGDFVVRPDVLSIERSSFTPRASGSVGDSFRVATSPRLLDPSLPGVQLLQDTPTQTIYRLSEIALSRIAHDERDHFRLLSDRLQLSYLSFDTQDEVLTLPQALTATSSEDHQLVLVQLAGVHHWLDAQDRLRNLGAIVLDAYIPYGGYLLWTDSATREALTQQLMPPPYQEAATGTEPLLQYVGPLHPYFKFPLRLLEPNGGDYFGDRHTFNIWLVDDPSLNAETEALLESALIEYYPYPPSYQPDNARILEANVDVPAFREILVELANRPDVYLIHDSYVSGGASGEPTGVTDNPSEPGFDPNRGSQAVAIPMLSAASKLILILVLVVAAIILPALRSGRL